MKGLSFKIMRVVVAVFVIASVFNNCSSSSTDPAISILTIDSPKNGTPYEGKLYLSDEQCSDGTPKAKILYYTDSYASLIQDNCSDLNPPISLDDSDFDLDVNNPNILNYRSRIFRAYMGPASMAVSATPTPTQTQTPAPTPTPLGVTALQQTRYQYVAMNVGFCGYESLEYFGLPSCTAAQANSIVCVNTTGVASDVRIGGHLTEYKCVAEGTTIDVQYYRPVSEGN